MNSEGMSSSAGGQFGSGTLGGSGMVSNLVLNSTEIMPNDTFNMPTSYQ